MSETKTRTIEDIESKLQMAEHCLMIAISALGGGIAFNTAQLTAMGKIKLNIHDDRANSDANGDRVVFITLECEKRLPSVFEQAPVVIKKGS